MRKYFISLMLTSVVALNTTTMIFAETKDINITIDNEVVEFTDAKPYVDKNGRTMIPVSRIGELLGVQVGWNNDTQTVTLKDGDNTVSLKINDDNITINGLTTKMDTKAVIKNGRTYVPVSTIAKAFGVTTGWDKDTNTVSLTSDVVVEKNDDKLTNTDVDVTNSTEVKRPKLTSTSSETVEKDGLIINAKLSGDDSSIYFEVDTNVPTKRYFFIGKSEYFETSNLTTEELINLADKEVEGKERMVFRTEDLYGNITHSYIDNRDYFTRGTTGLGITKEEIGVEYTGKVVCVTQTGETIGVIDFKFTYE